MPDDTADDGPQEYDVDAVYEAVKTLYGMEAETSVDAVVEDAYAAPELASHLDDQFSSIIHRTYDKEADVYGHDVANAFLAADGYAAADDALTAFEEWTRDAAAKLLGGTGIMIGGVNLSSDEYEEAITYHSMRRLLERKDAVMQDEADLFEPDEQSRDVDLSSA